MATRRIQVDHAVNGILNKLEMLVADRVTYHSVLEHDGPELPTFHQPLEQHLIVLVQAPIVLIAFAFFGHCHHMLVQEAHNIVGRRRQQKGEEHRATAVEHAVEISEIKAPVVGRLVSNHVNNSESTSDDCMPAKRVVERPLLRIFAKHDSGWHGPCGHTVLVECDRLFGRDLAANAAMRLLTEMHAPSDLREIGPDVVSVSR